MATSKSRKGKSRGSTTRPRLRRFTLKVRKIRKSSGLLGAQVTRYITASTFREADRLFKRSNPDYFILDISPKPPYKELK